MARYLAIALAFCATATAEEIPLEGIWAYGMPGTRDIRELSPGNDDDQTLESLRRFLKPSVNGKPAHRGFAVSGNGGEALNRAHDVLSGTTKPAARFPQGTELSAVFFAYESPFYVHLSKVEREGFAFRITYCLVPHESAETTNHFALIPLGDLPPGRYSVRVEQAPMEKKYIDVGFSPPPRSTGEYLVSRTFHFVVAE